MKRKAAIAAYDWGVPLLAFSIYFRKLVLSSEIGLGQYTHLGEEAWQEGKVKQSKKKQEEELFQGLVACLGP